MSASIQPADLGFFSTLAGAGSLSAAAREIGVTTPAVSKRLAAMEARLGVALVNRSTRRMGLTPEGELYLEYARRILGEIDDLAQLLGSTQAEPQGLLRVNAPLGFGRSHVAPVISKFARRHPQVEVQLQLSVNPPALTDDAFDVCVRFGAPPEARVVARRIASNRRLLCASPAYLARAGVPKVPHDLVRHACIGIRQGDEAYGVWRLALGRAAASTAEAVRTRGTLSTNDGAIAVLWALEGHGILLRAEWDVAHHLQAGRLVEVLPQYRTPDADIYAVYPHRHQMSTRVRVFIDFLAAALAKKQPGA
ncbi:LysR substrate-binding domain-containing protein [Xylophilus ampelinus]|uniref:LysR family transcriptional regulator n=1 Tax=Xylophilus ampelinus TaxID=54067 RepID=A0A318SK55_9BURK|nr:LysR substrate-binding domain-containing protein [Xylophilus ampelinus]MCS4510652.1 LysR substrate-binding domain-containing protein [Xylophilus ampelinus]PYE76344.1 LysR family transcriptional regulator [Xylophilus ampelinus]